MTRETPKQQGNNTRENIKKAAMTDSSASSDRRRRIFTIHQRSQRLERFQVFLLKDCMFLTTVQGGDWKQSLCSIKKHLLANVSFSSSFLSKYLV